MHLTVRVILASLVLTLATPACAPHAHDAAPRVDHSRLLQRGLTLANPRTRAGHLSAVALIDVDAAHALDVPELILEIYLYRSNVFAGSGRTVLRRHWDHDPDEWYLASDRFTIAGDPDALFNFIRDPDSWEVEARVAETGVDTSRMPLRWVYKPLPHIARLERQREMQRFTDSQ